MSKEKITSKNFDYENCCLNDLQSADPKELGKIVFRLAGKLNRVELELEALVNRF